MVFLLVHLEVTTSSITPDPTRFGVSGEDDQATQTRNFDLNGHNIIIDGANNGLAILPSSFNATLTATHTGSDANAQLNLIANLGVTTQFGLSTFDNNTSGFANLIGDSITGTLNLSANNGIVFGNYGVGTFSGSPNYFLGVDGSGNVIETWVPDSVVTAQNGLSLNSGDATIVELGGPSGTPAPLLNNRYISGDFLLSLSDGIMTIGTDTPIVSTLTVFDDRTANFFGTLSTKRHAVSGSPSVGYIGAEGQMLVTSGTTYSGTQPLGGMYGEFGFLGSGTWAYDGTASYVQLAGLSGVVTVYDDAAFNYTSGNSFFAGGQYWLNTAGSGTMDKFACLRALYPITTAGATTTQTITNHYGLYIDDIAVGLAGGYTVTNRWGIYQAGATEVNFLGGKTNFNTLINLAVFTNSSPVDGDIWRADNTNTGLKVRINGVTKTITVS